MTNLFEGSDCIQCLDGMKKSKYIDKSNKLNQSIHMEFTAIADNKSTDFISHLDNVVTSRIVYYMFLIQHCRTKKFEQYFIFKTRNC